MKRNGNNIIFSDDVTIESGSNKGKNLREILEAQDKAIKELRSNVKWIYQYGGVGSGSGGGGGTSSPWSISARLGDQVLINNSEPINFPEAGTYKLYLHINNPGGDTFTVTYSYTYNNVKETRTVRLTQDNNWTAEKDISISGNASITITALDGNGVDKSITGYYITNSYSFNCFFADNQGIGYTVLDNSLFISTIKAGGLKVAINYYLATTSLGIVNYSYTNFNDDTGSGSIDSSTSSEGTILLDAFTDISSVTNNSAGNYKFTIQFSVNGIRTNKTLSVNLIPEGLYLKVVPEEGIIYQDEQPTSNWYEYYTGSQSFALTPYNGSTNQGRSFPYTVSLDGVIQEEKINNLEERKATNCVLNFTTTGWHEVIFTITDSSTATTKTYKYWIYTKELESDLNWYPINPDDIDDPVQYPAHKSEYKQGITSQNTSGFSYKDTGSKVNGIITMYANSDERVINIDKTPDQANDCLICIGIQYNATNDDTKPILTIDSGNDANNIIIYQNKIVRGVTELGSMYLGKEETYGATIASNYHLISIYRRFIRSNNAGDQQLSELCVYMDGVLELVYPNYITTQEIYRSIKLSPSNYFINLLEVSYFNHNSPNAEKYTYMTDAGIVRYWYTYKQRIQGQTSISTDLLNYIENGFSLSEDNHVKVSASSINSIARATDVPVLVLKYDEAGYNPNPEEGQTSIPRFIEWSDKIYGANSNDSSKLNIGIAWSNGKSDVQDIDISNIAAGSGSIAAQFTLDIQGSTTRTYHAKNYTLGIQAADSTAGYTPLFSPRFKPNDTKTYLPEKAFTLKADVVDSSHSNNTSMGAFVNANTSKFTQATVGDTGKYTNYVKNCLTGFPILVFVQINNPGGEADKTECYYLGIYNCNLGRSSYFNLGYCATSNLPDDLRVSDNGFCVCAIQDSAYALKPNLTVSEISDNNIYWDFSEYGSSILFTVESGVDKQFMFDDTESGADASITNQRIQAFVEHTARAGGYVFTAIGKEMRSHENSYREKGSVPNVRIQYKKRMSSTGIPIYEVDESRTPPEDFTKDDLIKYINGQTSGTGTIAPYVDFPSLVEYYTVCMAFGLLDSVQKNLNIKTWNSGGTFYFAFYDMDTCLGIDNDGKNSTYFAFSDFWEDMSVKDSKKDYYNAVPVDVYRDYFDKSQADGIVGYDIASSYAFAVAKYARAMNNRDGFLEDVNLQSPQNLWATWRQGNGPLANADKFMETYYSGYMKNVDELMFNFNYRHKYLLTNDDEPTGFSTEISRFKGRRISYVREWLNGRLHILDAYFNIIGNTSITISDGKKYPSSDKQYYEAYPNANVTDTTNNDIYVIKDIFGSDQSYQDNLSFIIKAPDYSPLIMKMGDSLYYRYLLKKSTNKYKIETTGITGNNKWIFGGSALWTYLDSINSFVRTPFNISTNRLTTLNGNSGVVRSWNLNMPALQDVSLTSHDYQGELVFNASTVDNFPNLNNIDISNSSIQLKVYAENVKTVNLSSINTSSVILSDCNALETVTFGNSTISECSINPVWTNNITLRGNKIKKLTLGAKAGSNTSLTIADSALEELTLTNFKTVTIETCTKLKKITINGTDITYLAVSSSNSANNLENVIINATNLGTLNLNGCSNLKSLTIYGTCDKLTTFNIASAKLSSITYKNIPGTDSALLDLSPMTSLRNVIINYNPVVTKIRFANIQNTPIPIYAPFENCTSLERVYGNLIICCDSCFKGLTRFSIHGKTSEKWGDDAKTRNGVVLMPLEILSNIGTSDDHGTIVTKLDGLIGGDLNPNEFNPIFTSSVGWWKRGKEVTNIQFDRKKNVLSQICNDTSCTQFDIYYILNALALSHMTVDQSGYRSFWGNNSGENRFAFNENESNQPNRYMFYGCAKITSISEMITVTGSDNTKFPCPDHDADGNVTVDNGLISPLIKLTSFARLFNVGGYISRFFFRRKNDATYPLTNISYQDFPYIYDEIDSLDFSGVNSLASKISSNESVRQKMGNMTDFFKNLPDLTSINAICSPSYLDYDTLKILTGVKEVVNSFNTSYGRGTIDLQKIFSNKGNLETVSNSFKVSNASPDYNPGDRDGKVKFPITSGMFKDFTQLQNIGYYDTVDNNGGFTNITVDNWTGNPNTITGFNGSGLRKYINQSEFPYNIFDPCKAVLVNCPGLFQDIQLIRGGDYAGITPFEFPGNLFSECIRLRNVAAFLKNCNIPYTLNSEGFSKCTELENITQIFYHDVSNNNNSQLQGQIPTKLFYHGHVETSKVYYGTDKPDEAYTENDEGVITWKTRDEFDFDDPSHIKTVYFANYNRNIRYAFQAFYGCGSIEKYDVNYDETYGNAQNLIDRLTPTTTTEGTPWENIEYVNTSYIPFKYTISRESGMWKIRKDSKQETVLVDISKIYDGDQGELKAFLGPDNIDQVFCYEDINTDLTPARISSTKQDFTLNFFCAPDLLSYMKNTSTESANVIGMFKWCGSGEAKNGIDISSWMCGRICPYLLAYLNEVRDFSEFFYNCKGLSSLAKKDNQGEEEETYLIPKDFFSYAPKITTLNGTFQGVYFGNNPFLRVFDSLKNNSLDIRGIFAACRYGQDENTHSISGIFSTNKLTDIAGAFCYKAVSPIKDTETNRINITSDTYQDEPTNDKINWSNNFPESVQTSIKSSWIQYLYYGHSSEHAEEQYIDLSTNYNLGTSGN